MRRGSGQAADDDDGVASLSSRPPWRKERSYQAQYRLAAAAGRLA